MFFSLAGQNDLHYDWDIKHLLKIDIFVILGVTSRCDINIPSYEEFRQSQKSSFIIYVEID